MEQDFGSEAACTWPSNRRSTPPEFAQALCASPAVSPLGVHRIRVPALGSPTIHLDERVDALSWCREILPVICEGEINGVSRLRVNKVAGPDLILEMDGTLARLAVHAAGVRWREVLHQRQEELEPFDLRLLWDSGRSTEEELQICQWHRPVAWLGSSLFRRSAAFQQTGGPCEFDAWLTGDRWVLELTAALPRGEHRSAQQHDEFLELLLDEHLGLPLRIERKTCVCSDQFKGGSICFFHLVPRDEESTGRVQIRFCWDGEDGPGNPKVRLAAQRRGV